MRSNGNILVNEDTYTLYVPASQGYRDSNVNTNNVTMWSYLGANSNALNMTPVQLQAPDNTITSTAIQMPLSLAVGQTVTPKMLVLPGRSTIKEPLNTPGTSASLSLTNVLYITCLVDTTVYIELGGGQGGNVPVYTNGVDFNGDPTSQVGYYGGNGGFVSGLLDLAVGDALKVFIACAGTLVTDPTGTAAQGEGGLGTIFGGANGGGASYIVKYAGNRDRPNEALGRALSGSAGQLLAVAAGGGGASRNAAGGDAGFSDSRVTSSGDIAERTAYGMPPLAPSSGSYAGLEFVLGYAPFNVAYAAPSGYAGGSGLMSTGGASSVPDQVPVRGSNGRKLTPFVGRSGGSVETNSGTGGGGGGSGFFGGGAGGYNGLSKPKNIHGGGGGGSSVSYLRSPNTGTAVSLNLYRTGSWPVSTVGLADTQLASDGYLVLGVVN
jgi:hypothetical protein